MPVGYRTRFRGPIRSSIFGIVAVLLFFMSQGTAAAQVPPHWDPGNPHSPPGSHVQAQADPGESNEYAELPDASRSHQPVAMSPSDPMAQDTAQWQTILRKLDPDEQALLMESIAADKVASAEGAVAAERAVSDRAIVERVAASCALCTDQYTALSSLYSSTSGPDWDSNTNWMSGDPCTSSW